jgi:hypothetical protein
MVGSVGAVGDIHNNKSYFCPKKQKLFLYYSHTLLSTNNLSEI